MELFKLALVFIFILILFKFKFKIGIAIFFGALFLGLIFNQNVKELLTSVYNGILDWETLRLVLIVSFISTLGALLKNLGFTDKLVTGIENLSGSIKVTMMLLPALIGLMPMPGGALLSAPMVSSACVNHKVKPEFQAAVNYWFRHIFEFSWPIFPGMILAAVLLKVDIVQISLKQLPFTFVMILGGLIFLIFPMKGCSHTERNMPLKKAGLNVFYGIWPITLIVLITFIIGLDILYSIVTTLILFTILIRPKLKTFFVSLKDGFSVSIVSLIVGVMVFQTVINDSGAALDLANQITSWGVPDWAIISLSCFIMGVLTGILTGYIGVVFPILIALLIYPEPNFNHIILAYGSGLMGVMVSPLHLCLVLTNQYFGVKFSRVYPLLLGPAFFTGAVLALFIAMGYGS